MPDLIIRRETRVWQDRFRSYRIVVDGRERGTIARGAELRIPVGAGRHVVQLDLDWCTSPPLEVVVPADQPALLECGTVATPFTSYRIVTTSPGSYLWLREV